MKILKNIVTTTIRMLIGLYLLLIVLVHIPYLQECIGGQVATMLSDKLGTRISIGRINPGFFNRLIIDDVVIYDQRNKEMLKADRLSARVDIIPLTEGKISISSIQVFGSKFVFYKTSAEAKPNFRFILDSLASKDTTSKSPLNLRINSFIMQRGSVSFDRYDIPPTNGKLNTAHLHITDISTHIALKALKDDSINISVKKLALAEQSGLRIDRLSFKLIGNRTGCRLSNFRIKMPETDFAIKEIQAKYGFGKDGLDMATLKYHGEIAESDIKLSELSPLLPPLRKIGYTLSLAATFEGNGDYLEVSDIGVRSRHSDDLIIKANGWLKRKKKAPEWAVFLNDIRMSSEFISTVSSYGNTPEQAIKDLAEKVGNVRMDATVNSSDNNIAAIGKLESEAGDLNVRLALSGDKEFAGRIQTDNTSIGKILGHDDFGLIAADIDFNGSIGNDNTPVVNAHGTIPQLDFKGYKYRNISIDGEYSHGGLTGSLRTDDPNVRLDAEYAMSKSGNTAGVKFNASLHHLSPRAIMISDKWGDAVFSCKIDADFKAGNINDAVGSFSINDFTMSSPDDVFSIRHINLSTGFNDGRHFYLLNSDFGNAGITGTFDHKTLISSLTNFIREKLPTIPGLPPTVAGIHNDIYIRANIVSSEWLEKLFNVPLRLMAPLSLTGKIDDDTHEIFVNCLAPRFTYDGKLYENGAISITQPGDNLYGDVRVTKIMDNGESLNLRAYGNAVGNSLETSFTWSNNAMKKQSGTLNAVTQFFYDEDNHTAAKIEIKPSNVNINDTIWRVRPSDITYRKGYIDINGFAVTNNRQHITINGTASKNPADSLVVDLNDIDIEYILNLANFHAVDFSGRATGRACIYAPLGDMAAHGRMKVGDFRFEGGRMGELNANVKWNKSEKQIDIEAIANDTPGFTVINGYVSPSRSFIDLDITANGTRTDFVRSFTSSFLSDIDGRLDGSVKLAGPLSTINITGELVMNGSALVSSTNCKYYMRDDTIRFVPDEIKFDNAIIRDIHDNRGVLNGSIYHQHLTRLSYNLSVKADNLLAYDFDDFGDDTFYGTIFGSGTVGIRGKSGELYINADITPRKNSLFVYNVSNPDAIVNQKFIQWNDKTTAVTVGTKVPEDKAADKESMDMSTDIRMNFLINCTPDATLKLLMDARTNDYITLNGSGSLRATYYNKGAFNMFGTYLVDHGTYGITIQDIIKKNFTFNEGGKIIFGGDPYDAGLNLQAIHTVNGVSLSDLNIGNSFSNNTTRVNCLMNISGKPSAPQIDFDIDFPTISTDEKQMIRSIINSEDEMSQQVLYLLGVGRFYPQEANNATIQDDKQRSQTTLAMQSLLSGTISSQISNVLNTVINNNNWNFGANISTGDEGWNNAEYEGLLNGRLLNNRLLINGQFGYRDNANTTTTSFIGDFDIRYLLLPNGNLSVNVYNKTNDRYFTKSSLNTQGIGLIMKKDFSGLNELLGIPGKKRTRTKKTSEKKRAKNGK